MSAATLFWGLAFGAVGMGYFIYGRRQQNLPVLICGLGLCVLPYVVSNRWLLVLSGVALIALPFLRRE